MQHFPNIFLGRSS